jgi:hypothetical protein
MSPWFFTEAVPVEIRDGIGTRSGAAYAADAPNRVKAQQRPQEREWS